MATREVFRNEFAVLTLDESRAMVIFRRTSTPFGALGEVTRILDEIERAIAPPERSALRLLVDARDAPPSNRPEFEDLLRDHRRGLFAGYQRAAVLVKTAVGKLHVQRLGREHAAPANVFQDEQLALAFLLGK